MRVKFFGKKNNLWISPHCYKSYKKALFRWHKICTELDVEYPEEIKTFLLQVQNKARKY